MKLFHVLRHSKVEFGHIFSVIKNIYIYPELVGYMPRLLAALLSLSSRPILQCRCLKSTGLEQHDISTDSFKHLQEEEKIRFLCVLDGATGVICTIV